jgi:hypothetical protein
MKKQNYIELMQKFENVLKKDIIHCQNQKIEVLELINSKNPSDVNFMIHAIYELINESEERTNFLLQKLQTELTIQKI